MVTPMSNPSQSDQASDPTSVVSTELVDSGDEITVTMPKQILVELGRLAQILDVEPSVALRYAIAMTSNIYSEKKDGAMVMLEKDRKRFQVTLKDPRMFSKEMSGV